jgi:16S rRNA C967 or C1407 C5-methylase (RsmB/RsmF family)
MAARSTNPFNPAQATEILEEDEPFDETLAKVAADIEAEEETQELLAVDERPLFRFLRDNSQHVDAGLLKAEKDGYTHVEALAYAAPFFLIILKRDV